MEHYLVDTNVIIDLLIGREDADAACAVVDGAERGDSLFTFVRCHTPISTIHFAMSFHGSSALIAL